MQIAEYRLGESLGVGAAGFRYAATTPDGREWEVRLLTFAKADPVVWAALARRLRFLGLVANPAALRPHAAGLDHDPPYLVFEPTRPLEQPALADAGDVAGLLAGLLADAHRLGWSVGSFEPRRTHAGTLVVDLTGTAAAAWEESDPAADVARLGELFRTWFAPTADSRYRILADRMAASDPAARPTAEEVARAFAGTVISHDVPDFTVDTIPGRIVPPVEHRPSAHAPQLGDRIGRFVLRDTLGEGGMGTVFLADDPVDGTVVALKVLRADQAASDSARRRFVKEMRLAAAVFTPFVTRVIDANTDGDRCYLALEYVNGESLGRQLRRGVTFDEKTALTLIADAARGVAAAHAAGIVHRDLKPDNLMLPSAPGDGPRVKVTDFGLARQLVQTESLEITQAGTTLGTPLYMPPEQFGSGAIDARADVYALGATLFHMLTGRTPFTGNSLPEVARAVALEAAPVVDRVNPQVSAATAALVARCLAKSADDRPPDADALVRELDRLLNGEPGDSAAHPLAPASDSSRSFTFTWDLKSAPTKLWPLVANTERLNKATGLPAVNYELRKDANGVTRRFGVARVIGFRMEWEEHPYEWVEGRRMGVLREFARGPFAWFLSVVELTPNGTGGTTLRHTLSVHPRGLLGRIAAKLQVGGKAGKQLERVYRRMDEVLSGSSAGGPQADAFEPPPTSRYGKQLQEGINRLRATKADPTAVAALAAMLETAPEQEVAHIRPFAVARRYKVDDAAMADACLRSVGAGVLQLGWDVICPLCRLASARRDTLRELKEHEACVACDTSYQPDFAQSVELVFRVHPNIRQATVGTYCAGGPAHSPHVVAQTRLTAGERVELALSLSPGLYRVRSPQLPWLLDLTVTPSAFVRRWELNLAPSRPTPPPPLAPGGQTLTVRNDLDRTAVVRVERAVGRDDALTAARATALPAFRELFPDEVLSPGQLTAASAITLLYVGLDRSDEVFEAVGEGRAFQLLQAAVRRIEASVAAAGGTVVKTVGEAVMAAFDGSAVAVSTAYRLVESELAEPGATGRWKAGVHRGLAMVATVNDRLDYFGTTTKRAAQLFEAAGGGEVLLSDAVTADPDVIDLIRGRRLRRVEVRPGVSATVADVLLSGKQ